MFRWLMVLTIIISALEVWVLFAVGHAIGGWQTFALLIGSGILGVYLAKREALRVLYYARRDMSQGRAPTQSVLDGICVFAGGVLLVIPGFISDIIGLLLLFPVTRTIFKIMLLQWIRRRIFKRKSI